MSNLSKIKLELDFNANNVELVKELLAKSTSGTDAGNLKVVDAEEVKAPEAEKPAPKPRPSRAKAKPQPEPEEETIDEDEDLDDDGLEEGAEAEEEIDADDLRAKQAEKVGVHRATIKAKLQELGATGIKDLDEKHYSAYFDFLSKLK